MRSFYEPLTSTGETASASLSYDVRSKGYRRSMRTTLCSKAAWHDAPGRQESTSPKDPNPKTTPSTCHSKRTPSPAGARIPAPTWSLLHCRRATTARGYPTRRQGRPGVPTQTCGLVPHRSDQPAFSLTTISGRLPHHSRCTLQPCLGLTCPHNAMSPPSSMAPSQSIHRPSPSQLLASFTRAVSSCVLPTPPRCTLRLRAP